MTMHHGRAGKSVRDMATRRYFDLYLIGAGLLVCSLIMLSHLNTIAKLGFPAVFMIFLAVRIGWKHLERKSRYMIKRARDADRGALAEERVAARLGSLPEGYQGFHDLDFNGFNIDHVVVGPGGIFLIETKSHRGRITSDGENLLLNGKAPVKNFLTQTWRQTKDLELFLWKQTSKEWKIKPVLCFSNAFVGVREPVKGVTIARIGYLNKFLMRQPHVMKREDVEWIARIFSSWISRHQRNEGIHRG